MARPISIVPSVLPADFARLGEECAALEKAGVDRIQWDVMDGVFVPNLTFGPDVVAACRIALRRCPFEAHLMVVEPDPTFERWVEAGCELLIVHAESVRPPPPVARRASARPVRRWASPSTRPRRSAAVEHVLDLVDMVLVMTVNPGFGGQAYIATMEPKVAEVQRLVDERGLDIDIEVDGGIGPDTVAGAAAAGANLLVAGSSLYRDPEGLEHAVADLRAGPKRPSRAEGQATRRPGRRTGSAADAASMPDFEARTGWTRRWQGRRAHGSSRRSGLAGPKADEGASDLAADRRHPAVLRFPRRPAGRRTAQSC